MVLIRGASMIWFKHPAMPSTGAGHILTRFRWILGAMLTSITIPANTTRLATTCRQWEKTRRKELMMTLAIGNPIKRRNQCAFTLVEMILVMVLLVVAVSIVAPRLSGFMRERALDSEARRFLSLANAAQSRAVSEGMPMMLWIDEKNDKYGMEEETPGKTADTKAEDFTADENVMVAVMNLNGSATTFKNLPAIRFLADGTVD